MENEVLNDQEEAKDVTSDESEDEMAVDINLADEDEVSVDEALQDNGKMNEEDADEYGEEDEEEEEEEEDTFLARGSYRVKSKGKSKYISHRR